MPVCLTIHPCVHLSHVLLLYQKTQARITSVCRGYFHVDMNEERPSGSAVEMYPRHSSFWHIRYVRIFIGQKSLYCFQWHRQGVEGRTALSGNQQEAAKMRVITVTMVAIRRTSGISRPLGRQNCSPPRPPITHDTPLIVFH